MPVNYQNSKIYKIFSYENPDVVYIGSTSRLLLCDRMKGHRSSYRSWLNGKKINGKIKYCSSYELLKFDDNKIELICNCPCKSRDELRAIEGQYIRKYKADEKYCCVNISISGRTKKEYRDDNKEKISISNKIYRENNKDKIIKCKKEWYQKNKEYMREKNKKRKFNIKYTCECGSNIHYNSKKNHEKSKKHQNFIKLLI